MDFLLDTCGRRRCLLVMQLFVLKAAALCPKPQLGSHIVLTNEALLMNEFPEGSNATVECAHGYVNESGSGVMSCTGGKWTEPDLGCKKKDCGPPIPQPHMTFNLSDGTLFGAKIVVTCDKGFQISGSSYKTCYAGGWTGRAKCEMVMCEQPAEVANGRSLWDSQDEPKYGEIIEFACNEGFTLVGSKSIMCSDYGEYHPGPPECKGATTEDRRLLIGSANFSFIGATTEDRIAPRPAPTAQGFTSTDSSTISTAHRDKTITTSATATVSPAGQGTGTYLQHTVTEEEEASTTRVSSTMSSFRDKDDGGVNTIIGVITCVSFLCFLLAILLYVYKCRQSRKGSYDTREDLKPELLQFQNL